jgi:hypothetical protein
LEIPSLWQRLRETPVELALHTAVDGRSAEDKARDTLAGETPVYAAVTVGDLLYDLARIDPTAVEAIDFARAADLSDIFTLAQTASEVFASSAVEQAGHISQLQGYLAEHLVAASLLREQGTEVEFAASSSQPGWDLLVNGQPVQMKNLAEPAGIEEHLARYPDIPVMTSVEMAEKLPDNPMVLAVDGLRRADVVNTTTSSLDGSADLLDLHIPVITVGIQLARNGCAVARRTTGLSHALANVAVDVGMRAGGAQLGAVAAAAAFGVAGIASGYLAILAPVAGAIGGYDAARRLSSLPKLGLFARKEVADVATATGAYADALQRELRLMVGRARAWRDRITSDAEDSGRVGAAVKQDWRQRVDAEIEWRESLISEAEPRQFGLFGFVDPAAEAMRMFELAARAGVPPFRCARELQQLQSALAQLQNKKMRHLISGR